MEVFVLEKPKKYLECCASYNVRSKIQVDLFKHKNYNFIYL